MRGTGFYIFAGFLGMPITRDDFYVQKIRLRIYAWTNHPYDG